MSLRRGRRGAALRRRPSGPVAFKREHKIHWPDVQKLRQRRIYLLMFPVAVLAAGFFLIMNTFTQAPVAEEAPPPEMQEVQLQAPPPPPPEPEDVPEPDDAEPEPLPDLAALPEASEAPIGPAIAGASLDLALGSGSDGLAIAGAGGGGGGGSASGSGRMVLEPGQADQNPEVVDAPAPELPVKAREAGVSGAFEAIFVVSAEGRPTQIQVRGEPSGYGFEDAIVKSIKRRRYKPAMQGGAPVPMKLSVPFDFAVE